MCVVSTGTELSGFRLFMVRFPSGFFNRKFREGVANILLRQLFHCCIMYAKYKQGRIEPPKAARGHATYIDGKMLSVTKYRIQIWTV